MFPAPMQGGEAEIIKGLKAEIVDLRKEKASATELMQRCVGCYFAFV